MQRAPSISFPTVKAAQNWNLLALTLCCSSSLFPFQPREITNGHKLYFQILEWMRTPWSRAVICELTGASLPLLGGENEYYHLLGGSLCFLRWIPAIKQVWVCIRTCQAVHFPSQRQKSIRSQQIPALIRVQTNPCSYQGAGCWLWLEIKPP